MSCEYVREGYNVPAEIGRIIDYNGKQGVISEDRGNYIGVTFDDEKAGTVSNFHPTTEGLTYGDMGIVRVRKMTRSQKNYQLFIDIDPGCSFAEWMRFKTV